MNSKFWISPFLAIFFFCATAQGQQEQVENNIDNFKIPRLDSLSKVANEYLLQDNYAKSFEKNVELLKASLELKNLYYIHVAYSSLGYDHLSLEDTLQAHRSFEKSFEYAKKSNRKNAIARAELDLAVSYATSVETINMSDAYFNKSIALYKKINDHSGLRAAYYNIANRSINFKDYDRMLEALGQLEEVVIQNPTSLKFTQDENHIKFIATNRGLYQLEQKDYELADIYLNQALVLAQKTTYNSDLDKIYQLLARSLEEQGRYKEATAYQKKYIEQFKENEQNRITNKTINISANLKVSEYKKDLEKIELEKALEQEKLRNTTFVNFILTIVSILFALMVIYLIHISRKRAELVKEVNLQNKEYLIAKEESEEMAKSKSKFFSTVSHELRTPLYGVIGLSTILLEDITLKKHKQDLKSLKFSADYLLALINDVLQINKIDSNKVDNQEKVFNIRELVNSIASSFEYMRIQNNNTLTIQISDTLPKEARGNVVRLSQILMNLIGNAMKFTENGDVQITVKENNATEGKTAIYFAIKDTGAGIAREKQQAIFDEFSQIDSLNYTHQGTGLGLPIVSKLLQQAGSRICLDSTLGKGSTFSFSLLLERVSGNTFQEDVTNHFVLDPAMLKEKHILIVDDNRINQIVTKKVLEKSEVRCSLASNGVEAVQKVRENTYDLVLMDVNMPVMGGLEATIEIRKFSSIPIIALTAVEIEEMRQKITDSGMNDIIIKPYDIEKFKETILRNMISTEAPQMVGA